MGNMLTSQEEFGGYVVGEKLSVRHDGEREVYLAEDVEGKNVVLTVFNLQSERYAAENSEEKDAADIIQEIRFFKENRNLEGVPKFLDCGLASQNGESYAWIAQEYVDGESLHSILRKSGSLDLADALEIATKVGKAAERVALVTRGGGHYNISTDNILVKYVGDQLVGEYLIGFSNMGPNYSGSHPIEVNGLDKRFRTPETVKGIFSNKTDVYALGMVTTIMLAGYPNVIKTESFSIDYGTDEINMEEISPSEFYEAMWSKAEEKLLPSYKLILRKATSLTAGSRFGNVQKFLEFLARLDKGQGKSKPESSPKASKPESRGSQEKQPNASEEKGLAKNKEKIGNGEKAMDAVAGMEELKNLFRRDFIRIVRNPKVAQAYGIKPSNCTLLYGPQGCGKTFIAEKAAQESGLKYRVVNPSELGSIYVHGAQQKIAELFEEAEKKGPMILIFDEFDALVPKRETDFHNNQANEVNEMLTQLNNCASRGIYVLATTNRPNLLDPAIMRKGRIDRTFFVSLPDKAARKELFKLEVEKRPHSEMDFDELAETTENYTCSDISYIVEECARLCFDKTLEEKLDDPLPLSMEGLKKVIKETIPSVSETQRKEFLDLKAKMENQRKDSGRKKVGFAL